MALEGVVGSMRALPSLPLEVLRMLLNRGIFSLPGMHRGLLVQGVISGSVNL